MSRFAYTAFLYIHSLLKYYIRLFWFGKIGIVIGLLLRVSHLYHPVFLFVFYPLHECVIKIEVLIVQISQLLWWTFEERYLISGLHIVNDIYCSSCQQILGWKYVSSQLLLTCSSMIISYSEWTWHQFSCNLSALLIWTHSFSYLVVFIWVLQCSIIRTELEYLGVMVKA